jgi:hypothetical protein
MSRIESQALLHAAKKAALLRQTVQGRVSANSASLSRSYAVPVDEVRAILRTEGVRDDG